jgi:hypothetical protein
MDGVSSGVLCKFLFDLGFRHAVMAASQPHGQWYGPSGHVQ